VPKPDSCTAANSIYSITSSARDKTASVIVRPSALAVVRFECLSSSKIDDEIELGGLLDWDIAWIRPTQNLIDIVAGAAELIRQVWSVGHHSPGLDVVADIEDGRKPVAQSNVMMRVRLAASTDCLARSAK
jgi:hypothetical protein